MACPHLSGHVGARQEPFTIAAKSTAGLLGMSTMVIEHATQARPLGLVRLSTQSRLNVGISALRPILVKKKTKNFAYSEHV